MMEKVNTSETSANSVYETMTIQYGNGCTVHGGGGVVTRGWKWESCSWRHVVVCSRLTTSTQSKTPSKTSATIKEPDLWYGIWNEHDEVKDAVHEWLKTQQRRTKETWRMLHTHTHTRARARRKRFPAHLFVGCAFYMSIHLLPLDLFALVFWSPMVNVCTICFKNHQPWILYLWVLYNSHCKQRLFP
jgi:hypothetical protein